jgi:RNA polymerase sigma-70 factor (ECF subfamily)
VTRLSSQELSRLAVAAARGDRSAFAHLLRQTTPRMATIIRASGVPVSEVEDLLQDASLAIWRALDRYQPEHPFEAWTAIIAANKARDHRRRRNVRRFWLDAEPVENAPDLADESPDPERQAGARADAARLQTAIAQLPDGLRTALLLTTISGFSHAEVAAATGASVKAIEARVARARASLKKALG